MENHHYMQRCIDIAKNGLGSVAPNPMVGCVVVYNDKIIGEGFTSPFGGSHAEVNAINAIKNKALLKESTLFVALEPCSHFGKTPPCSDLIIQSEIKKVFIACTDSFAKVNGQGIDKLKQAGIAVEVGLLGKEARELNKRFFTFHEKERPYVILKWAETKDGFVDKTRVLTEPSLKITSEESNVLVHKWRAEESAILVGKNTAILDNPSLTTRIYNGSNPIRILLDAELETPTSCDIFNSESKTIVFNAVKDSIQENIEYIKVSSTKNLGEILRHLYKRDIQSILIEGGPTIHRAFLNAGIWDEVRRFVSQTKANEGVAGAEMEVDFEEQFTIGIDQLFIYKNA